MSNLVLRFSYQVKRKRIWFSISGSWNEFCHHVTRLVLAQSIGAWIRVYFPMDVGQKARVSSFWFLWRCFFRLPRGWLKAQCIRSKTSSPRISSFFLKPLSRWVKSLKFNLANVEFGHKKWGWGFMMVKTCFWVYLGCELLATWMSKSEFCLRSASVVQAWFKEQGSSDRCFGVSN